MGEQRLRTPALDQVDSAELPEFHKLSKVPRQEIDQKIFTWFFKQRARKNKTKKRKTEAQSDVTNRLQAYSASEPFLFSL